MDEGLPRSYITASVPNHKNIALFVLQIDIVHYLGLGDPFKN